MDLALSGAKRPSSICLLSPGAMRVIPEGQMAPAEPSVAPDQQDEILQIFKSCFSDETSVGSLRVQT